MARSTYTVTLLIQWIILVGEGLSADQALPETANPGVQDMLWSLRSRNEESENDAIEMGRNAAEDMGRIMASPPVKINRLPQMTNGGQQNSRSEFSSYMNARNAQPNSPSFCDRYEAMSRASERSVAGRTIPLAPLPPLPIIPGLSPVPLLTPLIQSLTNPGRLGLGFGARPLLRTPLPIVHALQNPLPYLPALQNPLSYLPTPQYPLSYALPALRTAVPRYQLPRMNPVWIPPSTISSSYTPNQYARSANKNKPLVFYV